MIDTIVGLVAGAAGGNIIGKIAPKLDQGTLINSVSGIVGGGLGATILGALGAPDPTGAAGQVAGLDIGSIIGAVAGGGVGGGVVLAIVGVVRSMLNK